MMASTWSFTRNRLRRAGPSALGVVLALLCVAVGAWLMERPLVRGHGPDYQRLRKPGTATSAGLAALAATPTHAAPTIVGDSSAAAAYAVHVADANTAAGAILWLHQIGEHVPAGTYAATTRSNASEYQVLAGAFSNAGGAIALLGSLRARGAIGESSGTVVHVPLAFLIERDVASDFAAARVASLVARGLPVYALRQANGLAQLYAGAFASAADTGALAAALRSAGIHATLAYRTGRSF